MDLLHKLIPERCEEFVYTEEFFHEWNSHNNPSKQRRMVKALGDFSLYSDREFSKKNIFTKCEVLLKRHDPEWAGRLVNDSTDLHNALSGPFLQAATKRLNTLLDNRGSSAQDYHLAYGGTTDKVSDMLNNSGRKIDFAVECDFSGNDMRQVRTAQYCESEWLYQLGAPRWLCDLMTRANRYKVYNRNYNFQASVSWQLPSGTTSTTFRNCVWNLSIFHQWVLEHRVETFSVFVLGDDMVAVVFDHNFGQGNKRLKNAARSYEHVAKSACMKAKVKAWQSLAQAEFLSKNFVITSTGFRLIPKIGKALAKFNVRANKNETISNEEYLAGKALSYAWEYRYLPAFRERFLLLVDALGFDALKISIDAVTYNYASLIRELGTIAAARTIFVPKEDEITDDELCAFVGFRYSPTLWNSDLTELLEMLLFGSEDIELSRYEVLARVDYWD
jgi:hypothetical protein